MANTFYTPLYTKEIDKNLKDCKVRAYARAQLELIKKQTEVFVLLKSMKKVGFLLIKLPKKLWIMIIRLRK